MGFDAIDAEASFTLAQGAQFRMSGAFSVFFTKADPQNLESAPLIVVDQGKPEVMFLGAAGSSVLFSIRGERLSLAALQESQARRVFRVRNQAQQPSSNQGLEAKTAKPSAASHSSFMGDLDVYRILERQAPQFERCYRVLIQKLPQFTGIATLSFYLGETGEARDIMVRESFLDESFRRCLEEVVRRTRLPRLPSRQPIQIIFPISFE
jgi:hypothetical protein